MHGGGTTTLRRRVFRRWRIWAAGEPSRPKTESDIPRSSQKYGVEVSGATRSQIGRFRVERRISDSPWGNSEIRISGFRRRVSRRRCRLFCRGFGETLGPTAGVTRGPDGAEVPGATLSRMGRLRVGRPSQSGGKSGFPDFGDSSRDGGPQLFGAAFSYAAIGRFLEDFGQRRGPQFGGRDGSGPGRPWGGPAQDRPVPCRSASNQFPPNKSGDADIRILEFQRQCVWGVCNFAPPHFPTWPSAVGGGVSAENPPPSRGGSRLNIYMN